MTPLHLASLCGWLIMTRNKRRGGLKKDRHKLTKRSSKEMDLEWSSKEFQNMRVVRYSKAGPSRMPPRSQRGEASEGLILLQEWKVLPIVIHSQELLDIQLQWLLHNKLSHYFTKTFWDSWVLQSMSIPEEIWTNMYVYSHLFGNLQQTKETIPPNLA